MQKHVYGLDLGTYEIKIYDKNKDTFRIEKNTIAIKDKSLILAVGDAAYEMYEKTPGNIEVLFPMKEGVISRFNDMQVLLKKLLVNDGFFLRGAEYVVAVPTDVTEVEKRAFFDLVIHSAARAKEVNIVERGIADAIGLGLDVENKEGIFIANFGGETTELSVLSHGGMVVSKLLKIGGTTYDNAVAALVRKNHDFLIGRLTAETLRRHFGIFDQENTSFLRVSGRSLIAGVPCQQDIHIGLVRAAIREPLQECVHAMKALLERTPPEVLHAIWQDGIYLTGGIANVRGFKEYIEGSMGLKVTVAKQPERCAIEGLKKILNSDQLRKKTYSMLDDKIRWIK